MWYTATMERCVYTWIACLMVMSSTVATEFYGTLIGSFGNTTFHGVEGTIYAIDGSRIWVRGFSYNGAAPDAKFLAGSTELPSGNGVIIPDETGSTTRLHSYFNEDLILNLPEGTTFQNIKWIAIWCELVGVDFGSVTIPIDFLPPSEISIGELGFTPRVHNVHANDVIVLNTRQIKFINLVYDGFGPAAYFWTGDGTPDRHDERVLHPVGSSRRLPSFSGEDVLITFPSELTVQGVDFIGLWCERALQDFGHVPLRSNQTSNIPPYIDPPVEHCQVLVEDKFHISWSINSEENVITLTFRGIIDENEYLAFGISGSTSITQMFGSDVAVVWIDPETHLPRAEDYYLTAYSQCIPDDGRGACPDELQENGVSDVVLKSGRVREGVTIISVKRPISTESSTDRSVPLDGDVPVSWGIGFINPTGHVARHHTNPQDTVTVNFGNPTSDACPELIAPTVIPEPVEPWTIEPIYASQDVPMVAYIGSAGGRRGYQGIAGQVGWGIAWFIDDKLIPEIHVERGKTYTFMVFGGDDVSVLGNYHPFYITNSKNGGYAQQSELERQDEVIYAGPVEGSLCEYKGTTDPEDFGTFEKFVLDLTLECPDDPQPGVLTWTVTEDTPDLVYYQCYLHRFFGWKIHVTSPNNSESSTPYTTQASTDDPAPNSSSETPTMRQDPLSTVTIVSKDITTTKPDKTSSVSVVSNDVTTTKPDKTSTVSVVYNDVATTKPDKTSSVSVVSYDVPTTKPDKTSSVSVVSNDVTTTKPAKTSSVSVVFNDVPTTKPDKTSSVSVVSYDVPTTKPDKTSSVSVVSNDVTTTKPDKTSTVSVVSNDVTTTKPDKSSSVTVVSNDVIMTKEQKETSTRAATEKKNVEKIPTTSSVGKTKTRAINFMICLSILVNLWFVFV